jgi:uncharacterized protein (DUF1800 family)
MIRAFLQSLGAPILTMGLVFGLMPMQQAGAATDYFSTAPGVGSPDTLDDVWQALYNGWGLSAAADEDKDGCSNYVESVAATDPRNASDCIKVGNMVITAGNILFTFKAEAGKQYRVLSDASPGGAFTTVVSHIEPVSGMTLFVPSADNVAQVIKVAKAVGTRMFYRLEVTDVDTDNDGVSDWAERKTGTNPAVGTSPGNASGGTAADGAVMASLLSLTAAETTTVGYEAVDRSAAVPVSAPAKIALVRTVGTMALNNIPIQGVVPAPLTAAKGAATAADVVTSSLISIPAGQGVVGSPFLANVMPVNDGGGASPVEEVPERAMITLGLPGLPAAKGPSAAITVADADPTNGNNNELYVAFLGRESGAATTASGVATAIVKGDHTSASIGLTFSSLSSAQNTAYIRYGEPNNENNILQLPLGQVSGRPWNVVAASIVTSDQAMLDALRTGNVSVMISTSLFSTKEIFGYFNRANGSTTFNPARPDLVQPAIGSLTPVEVKRDVFRFLGQCTFGATTALYTEINNLIIAAGGAGGELTSGTTTSAQLLAGYTAWIDKQMDLAQTPSPNYRTLVMSADNEEFAMRGSKPLWAGNDPQFAGQSFTASYDAMGNLTNPMTTTTNGTFNNNHPFHNNRRREWWTMVVNSRDQMRQRMAAALQEIVVISENDSTVQDRHYGTANYWDMLAQNAFGSYRTILGNVTFSPMMGVYLSHIRNRARYVSGGVEIFPDENYAREIMQLFSIGLVQRHPDGSLILDGDGLLLPTYDQTDITELARVMTGFCTGARHASATVMRLSGNGNAMAPTSVRVSPQIEIQGVNFINFTEGGNEGWWQAGYLFPMKVLGRANGVTYHDFNPYVDSLSNVSTSVSKVLFAGKRGETELPLVNINGLSDVATHVEAEKEIGLALDAISNHPNTSVFVSRLLIQRLTSSNPSPGYLYRVAQAYANSGGNLGTTLKAILLDYEARSLVLADSRPGTSRVKEPLMHYTEMLRGLKAYSNAPISNLNQMTLGYSMTDSPLNTPYPTSELNKFPAGASRLRMSDLTTTIGQSPQKAPSVFNWFLPDYVPPGNLAAAGLFAPEIQIDTETILVNRVNRMYASAWMGITGATPGQGLDDFVSNAGNSAPELLTDVTTLTFTAANWNTPQTVTVTGYDDFDAEGTHSSSLFHTTASSDANYNNLTAAPVSFTIADNETSMGKLVSIVQSGGNTAVAEGGVTDTYTVVLTAAPSADVTVTPDVRSAFYTTAAPAVITDVAVSPSVLTFTSANWNVPQTVTVSATEDAVVNAFLTGAAPLNNRAAIIRHNISSTDADYQGELVSDIVVPITDNDGTTRLIVAETSATGNGGANGVSVVSEGTTSNTDTFSVGLAQGAAPTANVVVTLGFDSTRFTLAGTGLTSVTTGATATSTLTFAPATYTTAVTITITSVDDSTRQGVQFLPITFTTASTDASYNNLATPTLRVRVNDNDSDTVNGFTFIPYGGSNNIRAVEGGMTSQYLVCLNKAPTGDVTATWIGSSGDVAGIGSPVFTTSNWYIPQAVTVSGNNDIFVEPTRASPIRYTFAGGGYDSTASNPPAFNFVCTIGDDDLNSSAGVTLTESSGSTAVSEAGPTSDSFTIVLSGQPTSNVVFTLAAPAAQLSLSAPTLTFTPGNWSTAQTVTVTAVDDSVIDGTHSATIVITTASADTRYNNSPVADVVVTITDNDTGPAIVLAATGGNTTVTEGGATDTVNVSLSAAPAANVVVNLVGTTQLSYSPSTITFTTANWNTPVPVTVTAVDDAWPEPITNDSVLAATAAGSPAGFTNLTATLPVVLLDNDDMNNGGPGIGVQIVVSNGATRVIEGGMTDSFEVALRRAPIADVTLTATFGTLNQLTVDKPTLTFTPSNWNIPQTVAITPVDDAITEGAHSSTVVYTSNVSGNFNATDTASITCSIGDNEASRPAVYVSTTSGTITEGGAGLVYNVSLGTTPPVGTSVVVTPTAFLNGLNGLSNTTQLTFAPTTVTFTNADTAGTTKAITITGTSNTTAEPTQVLTVQNATSVSGTADINYSGMVAPDITVTVNDDDSTANRIAVTESGSNTIITEDSGTDTIDVSLVGPSNPASAVSVTLTSTGQMLFSNGGAPAASLTLSFTAVNAAQTISLTPVADFISEGVTTDTITLTTPSAGAAGFLSLSMTQLVRILDNDDIITNALSVSQTNTNTRVIEGGMTDTLEVILRRQPTGTVTLTPNFPSAGQITLTPSTLTFTPNDWATPKVVTVTATDDAVVEGAHSTNLFYSASGGGYVNTDISTPFTLSIGDNEAANPAVTITPVSGSVTEGGSTFVYTVGLAASPLTGATVRVTPSAFFNNAASTGQITFSPSSLDFTQAAGASVWNRATSNTITVTATDDTVAEALMNLIVANTVTTQSGTDARYNGTIAPDIALAVNDNETARLVGTTTGQLFGTNYVVVTEDAGTDTLQVRLTGPAPAAGSPVTVSVARAGSQVQFAFADGSTSTSAQTLTFTDADHTVPQTLTIMSVADTTFEGVHTDTINITTNASQPAPYTSLSTAIPVRIIDSDDMARSLISVYQTGNVTKVVEGGVTDSYSVILRRAPTANVVLTASYNPSQVSLSATDLTFTPTNWNMPQVVTVTAMDDSDIENVHTSAINYVSSSTGGYLVTDLASVTVAIGDNDAKGTALVNVVESGGFTRLGEGSTNTDTYTIALGFKPTANVTITPQAHNPLTGITGSNVVTFSAPLVFTPVNWNTPQTVTVTLANDATNNNNRFVFIGHRITTTDTAYATVSIPSVNAIIGDDDETTNAVYVLNTGGSTVLYESGAPNSDQVYVMLRKKPTATVTVTPTLNTVSQVTFSPATLSFTTTDWNLPQLLTLTAVNDAVADGNPATYTLTCTPNAAGGYAVGNTGTLANISIYDVSNRLVISQPTTSVSEGGTATYTVALSGAPTADVTVTIVTQKHARPNGYLAQQFGYFANDLPSSSQQRDNMLFDWSELSATYTAAYLAAKGATAETTTNAPTFHLAGTKAMIDQLDLWWCGGRMKAKWPDGTAATVPPTNQRQPIIDAILNAYATTTFSTAGTTFTDQVRDRCRYAAFLVSVAPAAITAH